MKEASPLLSEQPSSNLFLFLSVPHLRARHVHEIAPYLLNDFVSARRLNLPLLSFFEPARLSHSALQRRAKESSASLACAQSWLNAELGVVAAE